MPPANIKLTVAYDGTHYLGWQKTETGPSIEETLQQALETALQHPVVLQAASRTDAGVHAQGQIVNFFTSSDTTRLKHSLNCLLPKDIAILAVEEMPQAFHPTLDCAGKEYHYWICNGPIQSPHLRHHSWHYHYALDVAEMRKAVPYLLGIQDFSALCNVKKNAHYENHIRNLKCIDIIEEGDQRLRIEVTGNHFLYKMVRNIVGTLVYIGRGKIPSNTLPQLLKEGDRTQMGITAPAHGLFLHHIRYHNAGVSQ
jgi:tRNA pseudouridine38-40 synthase